MTVGRSSQRKGRAAELEITKIFRSYGILAQPGQAISFGTTPDITGIDGIHAEVKNVQNLNLPTALRQAAEDASYFSDGLPTVFHKHRGGVWVASMPLSAWLDLYKTALSGGFGRSESAGKDGNVICDKQTAKGAHCID